MENPHEYLANLHKRLDGLTEKALTNHRLGCEILAYAKRNQLDCKVMYDTFITGTDSNFYVSLSLAVRIKLRPEQHFRDMLGFLEDLEDNLALACYATEDEETLRLYKLTVDTSLYSSMSDKDARKKAQKLTGGYRYSIEVKVYPHSESTTCKLVKGTRTIELPDYTFECN